jgi:hypothetical protein
MQNLFLLAIAILLAVIHFFIVKRKTNDAKANLLELLLLYVLVVGVGLAGLMSFIGHVFFADAIATKIGWATGSPFQFEVGVGDGAWGVLGILCIWFRKNFWLATGLGWSLFLIGAGYGHVRETLINSNYAPYNYGYILPDLLLPVLIIVLLILNFNLFRGENAKP